MRIIVDIEDADRAFVTESKEHSGRILLSLAPGRTIPGHVVAEVVPHSAVGNGGKATAIYDVTLLEEME